MSVPAERTASGAIPVANVVRGRVDDHAVVPRSGADGVQLLTPELDLDALVWRRSDGFPAAELSLDDVVDFLVRLGEALTEDSRGYVDDAMGKILKVSTIGLGQLRKHMGTAIGLFDRDLMMMEYEQAFGTSDGGWTTVTPPGAAPYQKRWVPTRTVHIMAGNTPHGAPQAIVRTALVRGVALMKMPSNDPFTPAAVLRTMAELDPAHPLVQCFSAVYWPGGSADVESVLFRPQYFDKIIAWGGDSAIKNVTKYLGPGLELVSFDPGTSISLIDAEALESQEAMSTAAALSAVDINYQEGCTHARHQFVRGTDEHVDAYCAALLQAMHDFHGSFKGQLRPTPRDIVEEVDALRQLEPEYRVWGAYDGSGLIVRSAEPVDFYPDARTVNVVTLSALGDIRQFMTEATQTVGVYPPERKYEVRDVLAYGGVDRIAELGATSTGASAGLGRPHDGMIPLQHFVRWIYSTV
jgi:Acyl-CoA reductase (LuxC)